MRLHGLDHRIVKESRPDVPFLQHRRFGYSSVVLVGIDGKPERPPDNGKLPVISPGEAPASRRRAENAPARMAC